MEENTNTTATQGDDMGNGSSVQGQEEAKTFTQDDVNKIIQGRLDKLKAQAAKEQEAEYTQKLAELQAREMKLTVKERLNDRGMPKELADIITCTDEKDIDSKLDALQEIYGDKAKEKEERPTGFIQVGAASTPGAMYNPDPVRKAMGLE